MFRTGSSSSPQSIMALNSLAVENDGKSSGLMSFSCKIPSSSKAARLVPFSRGCAGVYQWVPSERAMLAMEVSVSRPCFTIRMSSHAPRRAKRRFASGAFVGVVDVVCLHQCQRMHMPHGVGGVADVFNAFFTIHYACLDDTCLADACLADRVQIIGQLQRCAFRPEVGAGIVQPSVVAGKVADPSVVDAYGFNK